MPRRISIFFLFISLVIGVLLWIFIPLVLEFLMNGQYRFEILVSFVLLIFFPITFFSYQDSQRNIRQKQLTHDLLILGIRDEDASSAGSESNDLLRTTQGSWRYIVHIILLLLVILIGLVLLLGPIRVGENEFFSQELLRAFQFSFIGSYLFSVQLIYRRYTTYDLEPAVYFYSWLNVIAGFVFSFIIFKPLSSASTTSTGIESGLRSIVAFVLGYFPSIALQFLNRLAFRATDVGQTRNNDIPLSLIEGLSELHLSRLRDNAIDNMQNLASADIRKLLLSTPFNAQEVIDWIDQAILYIHLDAGQIVNFRSGSIRSLSGFRNWWKDYLPTTDRENDELRRTVAQQVKSIPEQLDLLYSVTEIGTNTHYVIPYWANVKIFTKRIQEGYITTLPESLISLLEDLSLHSIAEVERSPKLREQIKRSKELKEQIETVRGAVKLTTADSYLGEALIFYIEAKYELALHHLKEGLKLDKNNLRLYRLLAQIYNITNQASKDDISKLASELVSLESYVIHNPQLTKEYVDTIQLILHQAANLTQTHLVELQRLQRVNSVYISYRRREATPIMLFFLRELELRGFNVLLGDNLLEKTTDPIDFGDPSTGWKNFLDKHLEGVTAFIFIITPSFFESLYMKVEQEYAIQHSAVIIPIAVGKVDLFAYDGTTLRNYLTLSLDDSTPEDYIRVMEQIESKLREGRSNKASA